MRPLLALALLAATAAPVAADDLSCRLTQACVQGGACLRADVIVQIDDATGARPVMRVAGRTRAVERTRNFFGTVFNGWNPAYQPAIEPGELWVRPDGRSEYIRRAAVEGVVIRTDYRGRCVLVPRAAGAAPTGGLK